MFAFVTSHNFGGLTFCFGVIFLRHCGSVEAVTVSLFVSRKNFYFFIMHKILQVDNAKPEDNPARDFI